MRGTYRRNHEGDYHCTEQMIKMMVRDAYEDGNDRMFLEYYTMDDIDIPTLEGYRVMFKTNNPEHIWNSLDHKEFLMQLGGYVVNRKDGTEGLTIAGLLMFGKGLPVRERFDYLRMDYIDKSNLIGDQRYSDRLTYDGTWENNLFNFIRMVVPRLTRDIPRPFQMDGIIRKDDTPQHKAVREAFTNMIIHADLMLNGLLRVEKYDDRFVLSNPGLLKLPVEQIYAGGESKPRNIENRVYVTKDVTKDVTKELTERQQIILEFMQADGTITISEMSQKTNVTERTIKRDIESLTEKGILSREGGRKEGRWVIRKI